jgi:aminomethyltransferase
MDFAQKTPLYEEHLHLGGKMAEFAGWAMPLWYPTGQVAEHHAVRRNCGLFDICHMGEFEISGPDSAAYLSMMLTNDAERMRDGQAMYHFLLNESGGVIDDCILYRFGETRWMLVVNAGNIRTDFDWLLSHAPVGVRLDNISDGTVKLDLQGPKAPRLMSKWIPRSELVQLKFFHFIPRVSIEGMDVLVSRTGYTGEIGFELYTDLRHARDFWNLLLSEGKPYGILPCGLGARDTLRLEAGLPLHGHELTPERVALGHPWEFAISREHDFIGKGALEAYGRRPNRQTVLPFVMDGKRKAMSGWETVRNGETVGKVLSGVISPSMNNLPIGFLESSRPLPQGERLSFSQGGAVPGLTGRIGASPFVPSTSRQKMEAFLS